MSDSSRGVLRLLLALGYAGGAVLLLLLLTKGNADALTARVIYTTVSLIVLGLVAMAGARLFDRPDRASLWGYVTVLIAVVTFVLLMVELWRDEVSFFFLYDTRMVTMVVISILFGGGALALSGEADSADQATRTASGVAILALVALGVLTVLAVSDVEVGARWFGVAAAVFLVSALSLPLLRLATGERAGGY